MKISQHKKTQVERGKGKFHQECFRAPVSEYKEKYVLNHIKISIAIKRKERHLVQFLHAALSRNLICLCFELQTELIIYWIVSFFSGNGVAHDVYRASAIVIPG